MSADIASSRADLLARNDELREANSNLVVATLAARDLTEAAEGARHKQDEFLAMLAHELRNPLAAIRTAAAVLVRVQGGDARSRPMFDVIQRQSDHMSRLLEDLLDAARITSGKVILRRQPTLVADFVRQAVEASRASIDLKQQHLTVDIPETPFIVDGDQVRLVQVIGNLLHNASKYTPDGGDISISVSQEGAEIILRITDSGVGIAAEALPGIFDLFSQVEQSLGRSQGGMGIGLTVARGMVELHGGTVEASSAGPDQGSTFRVSLPWVEHPVKPEAARTDAHTGHLPARILVVEDNADAALVLAMLLRMDGHTVDVADDGESAVRAIASSPPQVVICDVGLPGISGYEVATQVRAQGLKSLPLMIALTGYGGDIDRELALKAGFHHHLVKPVDPDVLLILIEAALRLESARA